ILSVMTIAAAVAGTAWTNETERKVRVCMEAGKNAPAVAAAQALASQMFSEIAVTIDWRGDWSTCPVSYLVVRLSVDTREDFLPGLVECAASGESECDHTGDSRGTWAELKQR